jgi:DNA mismatch repair protein MutS
MSVSYNREHECLVYDRKLKEGSGPRIYGLEVCKSLFMGDEFLDQAHAIRNKYYPESCGELSNKMSHYNAKKIRGMCEMCGERMGEEIHHINQQSAADTQGYIGSFHKNHTANLMSVCGDCHNKFHHSDNITLTKPVRTKTTKGYIYL